MILHGFQMPRIDRLASLYVYHPLSKLMARRAQQCVPVLLYHSISENLFGKFDRYHQINTAASVFAMQMRWLRQAGYRTIDLPEMMEAFETGRELNKKVVITFDDGYRDFYTDAFPVLKQCGFSATIFLASDRIRDQAACIEGADYLTWRDVRELHAQGITFGSHSVTHADLRSLGPDEIEYELGYSKEKIEQEIGAAVASFSYPFTLPEEDRDFTRYLADTLENLGYASGVCSAIGRVRRASTRFFLPRLPVNSWDDVELLRAKLEGGYDWLHWPQWFYKLVHHNVSLMASRSRDHLGSAK